MLTGIDTDVTTSVNVAGSGTQAVCNVGNDHVHTPAVPGSYGSFVFTPVVNSLDLWEGSEGVFDFGSTAALTGATC